MIPKDQITREYILAAITEIDQKGVPEDRHAKGFDLLYNGKAYPPKYVLSLAAKHATGKELKPGEFTGGEATNIGYLSATHVESTRSHGQPRHWSNKLQLLCRNHLMTYRVTN
jgi:hypothetical protein